MEKCRSEYDDIKLNLIKKSLESNCDEVYVPRERRKGDDGILNFINFVSFTVWVLIIILLVAVIKMKDSAMQMWHQSYLSVAVLLTVVCFTICTLTIVLNFMRHRRRSDRIKRSIVIYELITFVM